MRKQNGAAIRVIRERSLLSAVQVCEQLDALGIKCHPDTLRNIETEAKPASDVLIAGLARVLQVPVTALRNEGYTKPPRKKREKQPA